MCFLLAVASSPPRPIYAQSIPEAVGPFDTLIIRNATIIDGTGGPARGPTDIVIQKNVIEKMLPGDPIGRARLGTADIEAGNAHVIDAKGMYVIPGLRHAHTLYDQRSA